MAGWWAGPLVLIRDPVEPNSFNFSFLLLHDPVDEGLIVVALPHFIFHFSF